MTKEEIRRDLESSLKSPVWQRAKNALVGRELLSWATEVIYNLHIVDNAAFDYNAVLLEDMASLIRRANTLINTPTLTPYQYIKILNTIGTSRYYSSMPGLQNTEFYPYNICYQVGSARFYNIDYISTRALTYQQVTREFLDDMVLYQGTPCKLYSINTIDLDNDTASYTLSRITFTSSWSDGSEHFSNIVNLGKNVLVDSIEVLLYDNSTVKAFHRFDPLEIGIEELSYKLQYTLSGDLQLWFGDGLWGKFISDSDNIQITFLRETSVDYSDNGKIIISDVNGDTAIYNVEGSLVNQFDFGVVDRDTIGFARKSLLAAYAERSSLTSLEQITNYIKGFPEVVDVDLVSNAEADIDIKVLTKYDPTVLNGEYYYFGLNAIREHLLSRLSIFYNVRTMVAIPSVSITLNITSSLTSEQKNIVKNALKNKYQRQNYYFNEEFSTGSIIGDIRELTGLIVSAVTMTLNGSSISSYKISTAVPNFIIVI